MGRAKSTWKILMRKSRYWGIEQKLFMRISLKSSRSRFAKWKLQLIIENCAERKPYISYDYNRLIQLDNWPIWAGRNYFFFKTSWINNEESLSQRIRNEFFILTALFRNENDCRKRRRFMRTEDENESTVGLLCRWLCRWSLYITSFIFFSFIDIHQLLFS